MSTNHICLVLIVDLIAIALAGNQWFHGDMSGASACLVVIMSTCASLVIIPGIRSGL